MSNSIKVSVITACFNSAAFLEEAILSVLSQTHSNLELILIDDGSTDDTLEIARRYRAKDNRIVLIALSENSGPANARNAGIEIAKGEWIANLDSDDIAYPTRIEEELRLAISDCRLVMVGSNSDLIDREGRLIRHCFYPATHDALVQRLHSCRAFPPHSSMLYRSDVIRALSGYCPRYEQSEDFDLWLRISDTGRIAAVKRALVKMRVHTGNTSQAENGTMQCRYGYAAATCYYLRQRGIPDPSAAADDTTWQTFLTWLHHQLIEHSAYERLNLRRSVRSELTASRSRILGLMRSVAVLLRSRQALILATEKLVGSSLSRRLAHEWVIERNGCPSSIPVTS